MFSTVFLRVANGFYTTGLLEFAECPRHSTKGIKHSTNGSPSVTLGEQHSPKTVMAKPTLPSVFYRALGKCPTLGKVETEKNPKKMGIFTQKNEIFFIDGGPHRPAPTHLQHFSREFHGYAADAIRTRDQPETSRCARTSSTTTPHSHLCLDSVGYIILNRV